VLCQCITILQCIQWCVAMSISEYAYSPFLSLALRLSNLSPTLTAPPPFPSKSKPSFQRCSGGAMGLFPRWGFEAPDLRQCSDVFDGGVPSRQLLTFWLVMCVKTVLDCQPTIIKLGSKMTNKKNEVIGKMHINYLKYVFGFYENTLLSFWSLQFFFFKDQFFIFCYLYLRQFLFIKCWILFLYWFDQIIVTW
jgi:hypothetical protein